MKQTKKEMVQESNQLKQTASGTVTIELNKDLVTLANDIKSKTPSQVRADITNMTQAIEESYFEVAGMLHRINVDMLYTEWGYKSFSDYVNNELDFSLRKAQYFISFWQYFVNEIGDEAIVRMVRPIGWSKLKYLVGILDKTNVEFWVKRAMSVSKETLATDVALYKKKKKLKDKGIDVDNPSMAAEFIAGEKIHKNIVLSPSEAEIVELALEHAKKLSGVDSQGRNLSLICQDYLSMNNSTPGISGSKKSDLIQSFMLKYETALNVRVIVIDMESPDKEVIFGRDLLEG